MISDFKNLKVVGAPYKAGTLRRLSSLYLGLLPTSLYVTAQYFLFADETIHEYEIGEDEEESTQQKDSELGTEQDEVQKNDIIFEIKM